MLPPRRASSTFAPVYAGAPPAAPIVVGISPPCSCASAISSKETAESSMPAPTAMIVAMTLRHPAEVPDDRPDHQRGTG
ncbi:hypothetical protein [Micromonospora palomenae]|uniref:hypothetical protein n=1 Tax=Micromonospora palomenae TaxID=1461247 RepID=UPI003F89AD1F